MSKKFDEFKAALEKLCIEHDVELTVSITENLAVFDADGDGWKTPIDLMEDHTR